jgi:hypothetical protein
MGGDHDVYLQTTLDSGHFSDVFVQAIRVKSGVVHGDIDIMSMAYRDA